MSAEPASTRSRAAWSAVSKLSGIAGAVVARKLVGALWSAATSSRPEPPYNPADRRISWPMALQWAVAAGVGAGVARVVSQRAAAAGWEAATGTTPPGVTSG